MGLPFHGPNGPSSGSGLGLAREEMPGPGAGAGCPAIPSLPSNWVAVKEFKSSYHITGNPKGHASYIRT